MSEIIKLRTEQLREYAPKLHAGDKILLTGTVYTSRDAAHKRITALLDSGEPIPYDLKDAVIYYAGPTPSPEGKPIGSCGPTTSGRMDRFAPRFLDLGRVAMIGKGERDTAVIDAMKRFGAVYLCAVGGAGAIIAKAIKKAEVIAFDELGCESVKRMTVENFPATVAIDARGGNLFVSGRAEFCQNSNAAD